MVYENKGGLAVLFIILTKAGTVSVKESGEANEEATDGVLVTEKGENEGRKLCERILQVTPVFHGGPRWP